MTTNLTFAVGHKGSHLGSSPWRGDLEIAKNVAFARWKQIHQIAQGPHLMKMGANRGIVRAGESAGIAQDHVGGG